jgi:DNA-binding LytR/AlgR family response regulator
MTNIRCLLLDDEPIARQVLRAYAERLPFLHIAGECANALEAYRFLQQEDVEVIFCDVEMPQISGLEFLKALPNRPLVVLTTAYEQYALAGFDLDAVDYLLKPFAFDRFWRAAEKIKERVALQQLKQPAPLSMVLQSENSPPAVAGEEVIVIKENGQLIKVELIAIHYVEAMKDYVKIFLADRRLVTYLTLKKLEEALPATQFTRVHKSYLVRNDAIQRLQGNMLTLKSQVQIPVGPQFREAVLQVLRQYLIQR